MIKQALIGLGCLDALSRNHLAGDCDRMKFPVRLVAIALVVATVSVAIAIAIHEQYPSSILLMTLLLTILPNLLLWVVFIYVSDITLKGRYRTARALALLICLSLNLICYVGLYTSMPFDVDTADHMLVLILPVAETVLLLPILILLAIGYFFSRMMRGERR